MDIPIELLIVLAIFIFIIFWFFLTFILKQIKLWRYKPENDKGRSAEESRRAGFAGLQRPVLPERRSVFQAAIPDTSGENSSSTRKIVNPFRRR
jgi:hypothetical protein